MTTSFTTISAALSCSSFELLDIVVVVVNATVESDNQSKGFISVVDASTDVQAGISVYGSKLVDLLASLSPGCLLLVSGLESTGKSNTNNATAAAAAAIAPSRGHFRLSTNGYTSATTAEIKVLKGDDLENDKYNHHPNAPDLVKLSRRIRSQQALAQPTRCRRRRLADIQYPGQLSTVQVRVLSCEIMSSTEDGAQYIPPWQRKRRLHANKKKAYATLEDNGVRMVLIQCRKHMKELKVAQQNRVTIQMTNLLSSSRTNDAGEIVLTPTLQTLMLPAAAAAVDRKRQLSPIIQTQQQSILVDNDDNQSGGGCCCVVLSNIEAIFIDDVEKLLDPIHDAPSAFAASIVKTGPFPTYRSATVTLAAKQQQQGARSSSSVIVVKANASVIKTLCGSIDARQVLASAQTRRLVQELIKSLLTDESVQLKWTLTKDGNNIVRQVEIPRL
mmetsp:Transcript_3108/g.5096  ORF Transcript_3108/g.5096 Transcript_3108/m.5096 type:complete len:445 (-) Transcript_3108:123-1457(-)|eukprot:CAMPEP_0119007376 /NCGR_PEP_ID=MMETSP1176-20130426/2969_1 /TAXON_ID=265551 /ORGANISM="Synedropsis recta cf, Strain CCMP1620" /LENGTH=444 /DNA_ID=CAMNT_0006959509 /DNA_START=250 /DNA_END=1584 /DNA_ORIENTATION=-